MATIKMLLLFELVSKAETGSEPEGKLEKMSILEHAFFYTKETSLPF